METINGWWIGLTVLNRCFYGAAAFFGLIFLWQLVMSIAGLTGSGGDIESDYGGDWSHHSPHDAETTMSAFKLISLRSIIAFATLFTWAGSLYLNNGLAVSSAVSLALLWGIVAMAIAALIPYSMRKLTETGNIKLASCVGTPGSVYMDIPEGGQGEIRVTCSGVLTHVKARARGGMPIKAGTQIRVVRMLQPSVAEVEKITE